MDDTVLINSLKNAVEQLYKNDAYLLQSNHELHEQTVSHRLAVYLENNLRKSSIFRKGKFAVDCEYNKNGKNLKIVACYNCHNGDCTVKDNNSFENIKYVRPDIIVHKRGKNFPTNLLIVELKKETNRNTNEKDRDKMKLSAFTCQRQEDDKHHYQYQLGFFIEYSNKATTLQEFKNGKEATVYRFNVETNEWTD